MTVGLMRIIDRFVGVPLCLLFGLWKKIVPSKKRILPDEQIRNILVIKFFGMGSIILLTPALRAIKKKYPSARVTFLSFKTHRELLKRLSTIDDIYTISTETLDDFIRETISLRKKFKNNSFDIVYDFEFFSKFSSLLSAMTNAPKRIAFALPTRWRALLVTEQIPLRKERHVAKEFLSHVVPDNITIFLEQPKILDSDLALFKYSCKSKWNVQLQKGNIVTVNVNAGTAFLERRWDAERFVRLAQESFKDEITYFFIGSDEESVYVQSIVHAINKPNVINAAGELTFGELLVLLQTSSLVLTNDSGPLHIAAALGTKTLSLFGPESPEFYGPAGINHTVIYKKISCSPCMNVYNAKTFQCPYDARCMKEITVEEVATTMQQIMN